MRMTKGRLAFIFSLILAGACRQPAQTRKNSISTNSPKQKSYQKPPSSYNDSLKIRSSAVVFFEPDSVQLQKIKAVEDTLFFKGTMHEYFYLMRYAHTFLKEQWPQLKIIEARNVRYLLFQKADKTIDVIDLNKYEPKGMFAFDQHKAPVLIDIPNIESRIPDYFSGK